MHASVLCCETLQRSAFTCLSACSHGYLISDLLQNSRVYSACACSITGSAVANATIAHRDLMQCCCAVQLQPCIQDQQSPRAYETYPCRYEHSTPAAFTPIAAAAPAVVAVRWSVCCVCWQGVCTSLGIHEGMLCYLWEECGILGMANDQRNS